ncbi:eukaryotic translation initiation factor 2 subunit beta isoform X2 [Quercus lobata]|uniref:eukaryotic translation initiation factor 2 subunit beta isoform X2 n=1 Tax=Quercus lobata TaxID=97700 RepID=UPI0012471D22|nr:eukaryotic translation initiation factor 2 subunit beta isoform X2 [Quercus lobata]
MINGIGIVSLHVFTLFARLHRQPEHVMTFLPSEMGTSGSLGGQQQLVVRGRFAPKSFEGILQRCIILQIATFDPTKKKKKKKKGLGFADDSVDKLTEKTENVGGRHELGKTIVSDEEEVLNDENVDSWEDIDVMDEEGKGIVLMQNSWERTDRDYEYEELLSRMFNILRENNPELAGDRRRTVIRPPQVLREGTKKTVFVNFMDLCKTMHRQPEHVMTFLLAEMGTSGSLDGKQRLVVKGIFAPKNFEGILRRYINEYVMCNCCKSPDTILTEENRLFFLRCEQDISRAKFEEEKPFNG